MCLRAASGAQGGATPCGCSFITADRHRPPVRLQAAAWAPEPTRFSRIPVAPVQAAVWCKDEHRDDKGHEEADDDDDDDDGGAVRAADRLKLSRSDAAERSPLFGL